MLSPQHYNCLESNTTLMKMFLKINFCLILICAFIIDGKNFVSSFNFDSDEIITKRLNKWDKHEKVMLSYMNRSVDPCDDFYLYACGKWPSATGISDGDILGFVQKKINRQIEKILIEHQDDNDGVFKANLFFESCLSANHSKGLRPYIDNLPKPLLDAFDLTSDFSGRYFDWISVVAHMSLLNVNSVFELSILPHWKNRRKNSIYIDKLQIKFPRKMHFLEPKYGSGLYSHISSMIDTFHEINPGNFIDMKMIEGVLNVEKELSVISDDISSEDSDNDEPRTLLLSDLGILFPQIDWNKYFKIIFGDQVEEDFVVIVWNFGYIKRLSALLERSNQTTLRNFLLYKLLSSIDPIDNNDKSNKCMDFVHEGFGPLISQLYVKHFHKPEILPNISSIIENLKSSLIDLAYQSDWISPQSFGNILKKLNATTFLIGSDLEMVSQKLKVLKNYYKTLEIGSNTFYSNYWRVLEYNTRKKHSRLSKANWRHYSDEINQAVANAYYLKTKNRVVIPISILQEPIYDLEYPEPYNYGTLAFLIGHELTHGFDLTGIDYDCDGNVKPSVMEERTFHEYHNRMECLIQQYNSYYSLYTYTYEEISKKDIFKLNENIADNIGLRIALNAFQKSLEEYSRRIFRRNKPDDFFKFANYRIFFLSFAQFFCSKHNQKDFLKLTIDDKHSFDRIRVIGSLSNMEEFSETFDCPADSPLNPETKCSIW